MKEPVYIIENQSDDKLSVRENIIKYLQKWPWFVGSVFLCVFIAFMFMRYAPVIYSSEAKIKIIDDSKEFDIATDALSFLGAGSNINLDNEIAVIKSYRILEQVLRSLHLDVEYHEVGNIKNKQIFKPPFKVFKLFEHDNIKGSITYEIEINENSVEITDAEGVTYVMDSASIEILDTKFPIRIDLNEDYSFKGNVKFHVKIKNRKETILGLIEKLKVNPLSGNSEVLSLKLENESPELSEAILNELINKFNFDGILDRQLVSKRTLDFIDNRFVYLSKELDSIELDKKEYKQSNNLSYIEADVGATIEKKSIVEKEVFEIETQIQLSKLLKQTLQDQSTYKLLPADIGVENANINNLVFEYNQVVLQREKLITSAGVNNPAVQLLSSQLETAKTNIIKSVNNYQKQLNISIKQLKREQGNTGASFSKLPEKEKRLRAIERQQLIKENLFLLLLQKREESAINYAVTAPSVKVVDYGLTSSRPISPKKIIILAIALLMGVMIPLGFFFTKFSFDTKIKNKIDLEKISGGIPVLAEIPALTNVYSVFDSNERSVKAESFRVLSANINYLLGKSDKAKAKTIYITSSIKGEGKTLIALNLAAAYVSLNKKVLLVGADLRNPQLHTYLNTNKNVTGLSNYLYDSDMDWKDCISSIENTNSHLDICFSGPIPPNASELIAGDNLKQFLDIAKNEYDYIIFDTAPTLMVADTMLMAEYADCTLFVTRSNYTDKRVIQFSKELSQTKKLKNMAFVINDVKFNKQFGYNYGYEYGYGEEA